MPRNLRAIALLALGLSLPVHAAAGQARAPVFAHWTVADPTGVTPLLAPAPAPPAARAIRWYHGAAALGVVALASLGDGDLRDQLQAHRSDGKDDVAAVFKHMGQPEVYAATGFGTIAAGLVLGNDRVRRAGERITAGLITAGVVTSVLKRLAGRERPPGAPDAWQFTPFSKRDSWPSGHTTEAFALATGVSDELHFLPATVTLYSAAGLTAWSRLNDNRHWGSDVLMGALVGITSAKLMNGHWRVFGISAPRFLLEPDQVGVSLTF